MDQLTALRALRRVVELGSFAAIRPRRKNWRSTIA